MSAVGEAAPRLCSSSEGSANEHTGTCDPSGTAFTQLLATNSLKQLLATANSLSAEVQQLEEEARTLIYDNHAEFVAAADLVTSAQEELIGTSTDRAKELEQSMEAVLAQGRTVYESLREGFRRFKVIIPQHMRSISLQVTSRQRLLLDGLKRVLQLPREMSNLIEGDRHVDAIQLYLDYGPFFRRHAKLPAIGNVEEQSKKLFDSAASALKAEKNVDAHAVELLLPVEDPMSLLSVWIVSSERQFRAELERVVASVTGCFPVGDVARLTSLARACADELVPVVLRTSEAGSRMFGTIEETALCIRSKLEAFVSTAVRSMCAAVSQASLEETQCDAVCVAAGDLRAALVPLQGHASVPALFAEFLHDLASHGIEKRSQLMLRDYLIQSLAALVASARTLPLDDDAGMSQLADMACKSAQALTVGLGTFVADCEHVVGGLFGSTPTGSRNRFAKQIEAVILLVLRQFESIAAFLYEVYPLCVGTDVCPQSHSPVTDDPLDIRSTLEEQFEGNYSVTTTVALVLTLHWVRVHAVPKLRWDRHPAPSPLSRVLLTDLFPGDPNVLGELANVSQSIAGNILATVADCWGQQLGHRFLDACPIIGTGLRAGLVPSDAAVAVGHEIVRITRFLQTLFCGASAKKIHRASVSWDRHLNWCSGDHANSIDVERLLLRRGPTTARTLPSISWSLTLLAVALVAIRCILEGSRALPFGKESSVQAQIDVIWIRDTFTACLEECPKSADRTRFGYVPKPDAQEERRLRRLVDMLVEEVMLVVTGERTDWLLSSPEIKHAVQRRLSVATDA